MKLKIISGLLIIMMFSFLHLYAHQNENATDSTAVAKQRITAAGLKSFFKRNELLIGTGTVIVCGMIVYLFWKKKKSKTGLDQVL
jgi:hypothetical protein